MPRTRKAGDSSIAVAYLRASTDKQELGLDTQRDAIERWAAAQSVRVAVFEVDEAVSGGTPLEERAGLQRAIAQLRKFNAGLLLVAKRDRLARDVVIAAMVERAVTREGAQLFSVDGIGNGDGPADTLMRTMVDGVAQFEKAIIRKRIKDALALKKTRLERVGGIPWGFRLSDDRTHLEPELDERETTRIVRRLAQNGLQYRKIVRALAEAGRFNRRGKIFGIKQISRLISGRNDHDEEKTESTREVRVVGRASLEETHGLQREGADRDRVHHRRSVDEDAGARTAPSAQESAQHVEGLHARKRRSAEERSARVPSGLASTTMGRENGGPSREVGSVSRIVCGRGHAHTEDGLGHFCIDGECALDAGKPLAIRRIEWRAS